MLNITALTIVVSLYQLPVKEAGVLTRHLQPASLLIIASLPLVFALFLCHQAGVGCAATAPTVFRGVGVERCGVDCVKLS